MAQIGKIERTVLDNNGDPISGATVTVYFQGSTLSAAGSNPYTVYDPGALTTASTVQRNTSTATNKAVTVVGATSITTQGIGLGSLVANDRLVQISPTPTLYLDATGTTSTGSNSMTTDANGYCSAWILGGAYDLIISATGYSTRLVTDFIVSAEKSQSNAFDAANNPVRIWGSSRTLGNSPLFEWHNPTGTRKAYITALGGFVGQAGTFSSNVAITGTLAVTSTSTLTGNVSCGGTLGVTGATTLSSTATVSSTLTASNGFTMTTGTFSVPANTMSKTYTADGSADQSITAGAYATANYVDVTSCTITFTPASAASEIVVMAVNPMYGGGATYVHYAAIRDGSNNILAESSTLQNDASALAPSEVTLIHRVTGLTGSQTFKVSVQCVTNNATLKNSTNAATKRVTRIVAIEHKF